MSRLDRAIRCIDSANAITEYLNQFNSTKSISKINQLVVSGEQDSRLTKGDFERVKSLAENRITYINSTNAIAKLKKLARQGDFAVTLKFEGQPQVKWESYNYDTVWFKGKLNSVEVVSRQQIENNRSSLSGLSGKGKWISV